MNINMMDFFTSTAFAAGEAPKQPGIMDMMILPLAFLVIMYFLMIRPQQKKAKEHQNLLSNLKPGDEVVTSGGIIGRIKSVADQFVTLEISNNVSLKILKPNVTSLTKPLLTKSEGDAKPAAT